MFPSWRPRRFGEQGSTKLTVYHRNIDRGPFNIVQASSDSRAAIFLHHIGKSTCVIEHVDETSQAAISRRAKVRIAKRRHLIYSGPRDFRTVPINWKGGRVV